MQVSFVQVTQPLSRAFVLLVILTFFVYLAIFTLVFVDKLVVTARGGTKHAVLPSKITVGFPRDDNSRPHTIESKVTSRSPVIFLPFLKPSYHAGV